VARPARQDLQGWGRGRDVDPFRGYKNAIDDKLADATAVLDAFYADVLVMPMLVVAGARILGLRR